MPALRHAAPVLLALAACFGAANADSLSAEFLVREWGSSTAPGGHVQMDLNADGTIAFSLNALGHRILGFAYSAPLTSQDVRWPNLGLPGNYVDASIATNSPNGHGDYATGFLGLFPWNDVSQLSWTVGMPGQFTSVYQAISGPNDYPFWLQTFDSSSNAPNQTTAWFGVLRPVSEPDTVALSLAGMALLAVLRGRARRKADEVDWT